MPPSTDPRFATHAAIRVIARGGRAARRTSLWLLLAALASTAFPSPALAATDTYDSQPPAIGSPTATPDTVDLTSSNKTVTLTTHLTDAGVGVSSMYFVAFGPNYSSNSSQMYRGNGTL